MTSMHSRLQALSVAALAVFAAGAQANKYTAVSLGPRAEPVSISSNGIVAGYRSHAHKDLVMEWRDGAWKVLDTGHADAVNAAGDVGGSGRILQHRNAMPAIWSAQGDIDLLDAPKKWWFGEVTAMADDGSSAGYFWHKQTGSADRCFRAGPDRVAVDMGSLGKGLVCHVTAMNNHGQIAGWATVDGHSGSHAFIWQSGQFQDLGVLPGHVNVFTFGMNELGDIVGSTDDYPSHAVLWSHGMVTELGTLGKYIRFEAHAINSQGVIVGVGWTDCCDTEAVRFEGSQAITLSTEITGDDGWFLRTVDSINDDGVIVGMGSHRTEPGEVAYMLIPQKE